MTNKQALKIYDDYLPQILHVIHQYYKDLPVDEGEDANFFGEYATKQKLREMRNDPLQEKHAKSMTSQNIDALSEEEFIQTEIIEAIASKIVDRSNGELSEEEALELLRQALNERALEEYLDELPEFLYRGTNEEVDFEKEGFEGVEEEYPERDDASPTGKVVFVSSEPSVASSYARKDKFDRAGYLPTSHGDFVYRIRTQGLDPSLFKKDVGATHDEIMYGPQYRYNSSIPQEQITIVDSSGTERVVPRIEKISYLSDALCKDIIFPPHIIDAINKRF